jgi:RNA recognition motif-containing protein
MAQNLFIGSLAWTTKDEDLKAFFETIGPVTSARVITDRDTRKSRGFGFVEYENEEDNQKAVKELNGKTLDGREITVSLAQAKEDRGGERGGYRGGNRGDSYGGGSFRRAA